jgi:hypothetical protein
MENFDWVSFFFYAAIGWVVMRILNIYLTAKNEALQKEINVLNEKIQSRFISVKVEKHGDMFYLFDKNNDTFVAQGRNLEEVGRHVDERFKGTKVVFGNNDELTQAGLK